MDMLLNDRLVDLHHYVADLKVYDTATGIKLQHFSVEFDSLLDELIKYDIKKFTAVKTAYLHDTAPYCEKAAKSPSEDDRIEAFYDGVGKLNDHINDCLDYFSSKA